MMNLFEKKYVLETLKLTDKKKKPPVWAGFRWFQAADIFSHIKGETKSQMERKTMEMDSCFQIPATTIAKLIEAHIEKDEEKFLSCANFIADGYEKHGEDRKARIIRSRINGSYKNQPKIVLD